MKKIMLAAIVPIFVYAYVALNSHPTYESNYFPGNSVKSARLTYDTNKQTYILNVQYVGDNSAAIVEPVKVKNTLAGIEVKGPGTDFTLSHTIPGFPFDFYGTPNNFPAIWHKVSEK